MKVEQRLHTEYKQVVTLEINDEENPDEIILTFGLEDESPYGQRRLILNRKEAVELSTLLKTSVDKIKINSI